jgi:outer membrane protein assembly factor BamE
MFFSSLFPVSRRLVNGFFCAVAVGVVGCAAPQDAGDFLGFITPYKVEVVQGNVITKEQAALIRVGMSPAQVRDVLGSPLLTDAFHANRWDYVFTIRRQGAEPQLRRVKALFEGEALQSLDTGGELPSEQEFVASIDTFKTPRNAPALELTPEQLSALPLPKSAAPSASSASPAAASARPARDYPPLERLP